MLCWRLRLRLKQQSTRWRFQPRQLHFRKANIAQLLRSARRRQNYENIALDSIDDSGRSLIDGLGLRAAEGKAWRERRLALLGGIRPNAGFSHHRPASKRTEC